MPDCENLYASENTGGYLVAREYQEDFEAKGSPVHVCGVKNNIGSINVGCHRVFESSQGGFIQACGWSPKDRKRCGVARATGDILAPFAIADLQELAKQKVDCGVNEGLRVLEQDFGYESVFIRTWELMGVDSGQTYAKRILNVSRKEVVLVRKPWGCRNLLGWVIKKNDYGKS